MKRRRFIQSIPLLYASPALYAQSIAKIEIASPGAVGQPVSRFFSAPQFAALRRLSDIILPRISEAPGALDAGAPEFLDFLVGESPLPTRSLYRNGLDALNAQASAKFGKAFAAIDDTQADDLLAPLRKPWTWQAHGPELACSTCASTLIPADPFAAFLQHAKADILTATTNSREWITAAQRSRGGGGNGTYWLPAE